MAYTEKECSRAVQALLQPYCDDAYSHEVGGLGQWEGGKFKARAGGTRTTPGFPDLTFYMRTPRNVTLTVEAKGSSTRVRPEQWLFAWHRMHRGDPHLIVRSPEALVAGLRFLGLLPDRLIGEPVLALPENAAFLHATRTNMVLRHGWRLPKYATDMELQWGSRRRLVLPEHVPIMVQQAQARRARTTAIRRSRRRR